MATAADYIAVIDKKIQSTISEKYSEPAKLYDPIKYILSSGGKRVRAVFTLLGCELFSGSYEAAVSAAAGVEVFHNFTLLHDDIMDKASIRRGKPTVHEKWNDNIAILSGDAMMILANKLVTESPAESLQAVFECFNQTALEVCEGQQIDMNLEEITLDDSSNTTGTYLNMIKLKTSVLIAAALKMGASIGGASEKQQELIYNSGLSLGLGFQLQDDLLDSFGNAETFGKRIGGDILVKKKTYLVSKALEIATPEQKQELIDLYNAQPKDEEAHIKKVQDLFVNTGAKAQTEELIDLYFSRAFELLGSVENQSSQALEMLREFYKTISTRKS